MVKPTFNPDCKAVLDLLLLPLPHVVTGKMFGYPAYYVNRSLVACLYGDVVGVKVPEELAQRLLATEHHVRPFRPMGRSPMREWIEIARNHAPDYANDIDVFRAAVAYAASRLKK